MPRALITGITGMDGSHLADLLLAKGYEVHGLIRRTSTPSTSRIAHILPRLRLHEADMTDAGSLERAVIESQPDEVYNLAAQSHVGTSFIEPHLTHRVNDDGVRHLLHAVLLHAPRARVYQASTSEMWGTESPPQSEATPFAPVSPYAKAKLEAHVTAQRMRSEGLFVACGILCNHESERRGAEFLTRKVTLAAARIRADIVAGRAPRKLRLGNLDAERDWGYAPDYVEAMWRMLQRDRPDDFVVATGESHTVREWVETVFAWHGLEWREHVETDGALYRPNEVPALRGDAAKARAVLEWEPTVRFRELVERMSESDWEAVR